MATAFLYLLHQIQSHIDLKSLFRTNNRHKQNAELSKSKFVYCSCLDSSVAVMMTTSQAEESNLELKWKHFFFFYQD